jgi:hypothetical protein
MAKDKINLVPADAAYGYPVGTEPAVYSSPDGDASLVVLAKVGPGDVLEPIFPATSQDIGSDGSSPRAESILGGSSGVKGWLRGILERLHGVLSVAGTRSNAGTDSATGANHLTAGGVGRNGFLKPIAVENNGSVRISNGNYDSGEISITASGQSQSMAVQGGGGTFLFSARFDATAFTGTLTFEVWRVGAATWSPIMTFRKDAAVWASTGGHAGSVNSITLYECSAFGISDIRVRCSSFTSGTAFLRITGTETITARETAVYNALVIAGNAAHNVAAGAGNLSPTAFESRTTLRTATNDATLSRPIADKIGRIVVKNGQIRELQNSAPLTLSTTTETVFLSAVAGVFNDLTAIWVSNGSATTVRVDLRDSIAGTVRASFWIPANFLGQLALPQSVLKQSTANTSWTLQLATAVADCRFVGFWEQAL